MARLRASRRSAYLIIENVLKDEVKALEFLVFDLLNVSVIEHVEATTNRRQRRH